ncbi:MAG TPA: AAA family ATPase [Streptosporangiaceae bacterium]|nr:AAA family ATPase [Streptosporangiaceae bacterium]
MTYPPGVRIAFHNRLAASWLDLADYVGIRPHEQNGFARGEEPHAIWDWLSDRGRLDDLHAALTAIGREDLARVLRSGQAGPDGAGLQCDNSALAAELSHFSGLAGEPDDEFIGRRSLLERLAATLDDPRFPSGYVVIGGEPGVGKTALLATLARRGKLVHHYNSALAAVTSAEKFLRNVCARLILKYHLPYDRLPEDVAADGATLLRLLEEAAKDQRVVVAVDAVDEVAASTTGNPLFLPSALPPGVIFVLTVRDLNGIELFVDDRRDLLIDGRDAEGRADAREYIDTFLARHAEIMTTRLAELGLDAAAFTGLLAERSEGNFLYLRHVLWSVRERRPDGSAMLTSLPAGLRAYFPYLEQRSSACGHGGIAPERQFAILAVLAVWPRPLTAGRLALFAGESVETTRTVLSWWSGFLTTSAAGGQTRFALAHTSFADYVCGRLDMGMVRARMEKAIEGSLL